MFRTTTSPASAREEGRPAYRPRQNFGLSRSFGRTMLRDDLVRRAAAQVICTYRGNALEFMLENEFRNRQRGHHSSADAWFDIAVAAAEILRRQASPG